MDGRTSEAHLIRGQALSGLAFGLFLTLHLANTVAGAWGEASYNAFLGTARAFYQFPPIEILGVAGAAIVHGTYGVRRGLRRRRRRREGIEPVAPAWLRWHRRSGWFLLLVLVGHVGATRGPGLVADLPAEFSFLRFSLNTWPLLWPYYFLLFSAGLYHLLHGGAIALHVAGLAVGPPTARRARVLLLLGLLGGGAGVLSMGGAWGEADTGRDPAYRSFYEEYLPFMVTW